MVNPTLLIAALPAAQALFLPFEDDSHADKIVDIESVHGAIVPPPPPMLGDNKAAKHHGGKGRKHVKGKKHHKGEKHALKAAYAVGQAAEAKDEDCPGAEGTAAPLVLSHTAAPHAIPDQYIIQFKTGVDPSLITEFTELLGGVHAEHGGVEALGIESGLRKLFDIGTFKGFAGKFMPETIEFIRRSPLVAFVEQDSKVFISEEHTENGAPWGLARVSHRKGLSLGSFNKYLYDDEGGEDVTAYVVDTGIYVDHNDFDGRAKWGKTIPVNDVDKDAHGHGTHCAGTIAGKTYGVAKKADVVAVKVLGSDGSGSMSDVIGGVEYVVEQHKKDMAKGKKGSTANMSLGGGKSPSLDLAVNAAVNHGVHFAVAAGNENQDACNVSPAGASEPITVGATTLGDDRAYFSNYGKCVDVFAPGVNILSTGTSGKDSTQIMSGTSMASPHVCGLLTYFLSLQPTSKSSYAQSTLTPKQLKKHLVSFGTKDVLDDIDSESPNVLVYNGGGKDLKDFYLAIASDSEGAAQASPIAGLGEQIEEIGHNLWEELHDAAVYVADKFDEVF